MYFNPGALAVSGGGFGQGSGPIFLNKVNCMGHEENLLQCGHSRIALQQPGCSHSSDAGVVCAHAGKNEHAWSILSDYITSLCKSLIASDTSPGFLRMFNSKSSLCQLISFPQLYRVWRMTSGWLVEQTQVDELKCALVACGAQYAETVLTTRQLPWSASGLDSKVGSLSPALKFSIINMLQLDINYCSTLHFLSAACLSHACALSKTLKQDMYC